MKRVQLFEFEDFSWFPDFIRSPMTRCLSVLNSWMGLDEAVGILLKKIVNQTNVKTIVDLGSGSGGVIPEVYSLLKKDQEHGDLNFIMTDLHPSQESIKRFNNDGNPNLVYHHQSLDATQLHEAPKGIKTMINSFHHMPPDTAKAILLSAQKSNQPILIFEMQENKIPTLIWALFLPLGLIITFIMALVTTPFSKPLRLSQLLLTYVIPIVPLCFAWDGQASYARMYSMDDVDELLSSLDKSDYSWEKGVGQKKDGKSIGTYLIGKPK